MPKIKFATAEAVNGKTPKGLTIAFRVVFLVSAAVILWLSQTNLVGEAAKMEITAALTVLEGLVWSAGRLFGIVPDGGEK